ncbi:porin [Dyella acidiphila]|uniref:Porin n=1 Tax=Dyella acidiphila TaxID=2775866 RepID=A0ABR9GCW0_9GAMM|nr:porin [Dyella acidiphila]MBE1161871.1 porin [Dyella acidiphila]
MPKHGYLFSTLALALAMASLPGAAMADGQGDDSLTKYGITLYGTIDLGVAYQTHGSAFSDAAATNVNNFLIRSSDKSNLSLASNGMSISTVGIKGREPLGDGWWGLFQFDTGFLPASATLIDGPGSLTRNNGVPQAQQKSYGDSGRAGQAFNGRAFIGIESPHYGTLTFGRVSTLLNDAVCKYDPLSCSLAFSYVGFFGSPAGNGDTGDRVLDGVLKYTVVNGAFHGGAMYQFGNATLVSDQPGTAYQLDLGASHGAWSFDGVLAHKNDSISFGAPMTAAQVAALTTPGSSSYGLPVDQTLPGTVSDNTTYMFLGEYDAGRAKFFAAYEHVRYANPSAPMAVGTQTVGGYFVVPNNDAFPRPKILQIAWVGMRYALTPSIDLFGAYYRAIQDSYGLHDCSNQSSPQCSGYYNALSLVIDKKFNRHFDVYGGLQWSRVYDGFASGYLQRGSFDPSIGVRITF